MFYGSVAKLEICPSMAMDRYSKFRIFRTAREREQMVTAQVNSELIFWQSGTTLAPILVR